MSAYLMGRVFYLDLPHHLKLTLLALADHADDEGNNVTVGQARIAAKVGGGERTVRRHIGELREMGLIERVGRVGSRGQDRHRIVVDRLPTDEQIRLAFPASAGQSGRPATVAARSPRPATRGRSRPATAVAAEPPVEPSVDLTPVAAPRRDEVFEAVAEACGVDWQHLTGSARGSLNRAVSEIRKASPEVEPGMVHARAAAWPFDVPLTPPGLAKHWPALGNGRRPGSGHWLDRMYREAGA